jgi:hypothetical protein
VPRVDRARAGYERASRPRPAKLATNLMLMHLPDGYKPEQVRDDARRQDPDAAGDPPRVTDLGPRPRDARPEKVSVAAGGIYFCDPHAP